MILEPHLRHRPPNALISPSITFQSLQLTYGPVLCLLLDCQIADQDVLLLSSKYTRHQLRRGTSQALGCRRRGLPSISSPGQKRRNTMTSRAVSHFGQRNTPFVPQVTHGYSDRRPFLRLTATPVPSHLSQETITPVPTQALQSGKVSSSRICPVLHLPSQTVQKTV